MVSLEDDSYRPIINEVEDIPFFLWVSHCSRSCAIDVSLVLACFLRAQP